MEQAETIDLGAVKEVVVDVLGIADRAHALDAATPLLGSMPELDSMAVMELLLELERRFAIVVDDEDITAETFETLGSLARFVDHKLLAASRAEEMPLM